MTREGERGICQEYFCMKEYYLENLVYGLTQFLLSLRSLSSSLIALSLSLVMEIKTVQLRKHHSRHERFSFVSDTEAVHYHQVCPLLICLYIFQNWLLSYNKRKSFITRRLASKYSLSFMKPGIFCVKLFSNG